MDIQVMIISYIINECELNNNHSLNNLKYISIIIKFD